MTLATLLKEAQGRVDRMTPEQREAMYKAQRESFVRGMMPAGHGITKEQVRARLAEVDREIANSPCWGAALSELLEEQEELQARLA